MMLKFSDKLRQAIEVGMIEIDHSEKTAVILGPPDPAELGEDEWLALITGASQIGKELEANGYQVTY